MKRIGFSPRRWLGRSRCFFCAGLAAVLIAHPLHAEAAPVLSPDELKRMSVEQLLQQEVVSVSRHAEALGEAASNVFYFPGDSARGAGAKSLPELLRLAPNLFVAQSSSYHWGVAARGFLRTNAYSNKLLVLVDGRTAYSPLFSNVFWDSTDVFLPDLKSVEVISGPAGSNWGANAVNGVINIESKSARDTLGGLAQVTVGSEMSQVNVRQGFKLGRDGAMRIYARRTDRDSTLTATGAEDDFDKWHATEAGFRADWGNAADGEFTLQGDGRRGHYDDRPLSPILNDSANLIARWSRELSPDSRLWVRAYYDYVQRNSSNFLTETTHTADFEFQHQKDFANGQQLLWGANFRSLDDTSKDTLGFAILPAHLRFNVGSAFAQHEVGFAHNALRLTTGLRLEHNYFSGWETQPTLRLAWRQPGHTVWLSASRATRIPSRLDADFFIPATPPYVVAGGPNFTSETLLAYELGWRGQIARGLAITGTVFYNDYDRLRTTELSNPVVIGNGAEGHSYGGEVFLDYDVTPAWRLRCGGFLIRQSTGLKPGHTDSEGAQGEASFPRTSAFIRSNFRLTPEVDLWLSLRHVSEVPANADGGGIVPAYASLDARLGWKVNPGWEIALFGRNLLDPSHPEIGGINVRREIQRSVELTLRYEY